MLTIPVINLDQHGIQTLFELDWNRVPCWLSRKMILVLENLSIIQPNLDAIIGTKYKPPAERKKVVPNVYQQKLEALRAASKERQRRAGLETIKEEPMQSPTARSEESEHPEHEDAPALAALA